ALQYLHPVVPLEQLIAVMVELLLQAFQPPERLAVSIGLLLPLHVRLPALLGCTQALLLDSQLFLERSDLDAQRRIAGGVVVWHFRLPVFCLLVDIGLAVYRLPFRLGVAAAFLGVLCGSRKSAAQNGRDGVDDILGQAT